MSREDRLKQLDKAHVWHPFTQMSEWTDPLVIERGDGNYLFDTDGNRYFDGVSSLWVTLHGHNHPHINRAITEQLGLLAHSTLLGLANVPSIELAAALVKLAPGALNRVFYSDSGSTAVEIALKQAFQYWRHQGQERPHFAYLDQSYHGDTLGAVGVGGISVFHEVFSPLVRPLDPEMRVATPATFRGGGRQRRGWGECAELSLAALKGLLERRAGEIAAMIVEPVMQGAAGMLSQPAGYLKSVAELCREHGVLLIADEVATGFGRTGRMFACELEGVEPDFLCVAKGLSGGYLPLAATLTTERIFEGFLAPRKDGRTFFHGHTYTGNPLACAAGVASLEVFQRERVMEQLPSKIEHLAGRLASLQRIAQVGEVRQRGLMVGVELVQDDTWRAFPPEAFVGAKVCQEARAEGVILRPLGDVIVMMPPLSASFEELNLMVDAVGSVLRRLFA